jgi:hypothetical protein
MTPVKRKTACHENGSKARQHVNGPVFMRCVLDNDLVIDRQKSYSTVPA